MRVDEKELRRIVNKHLIMTEVKRSYALSLLKEEVSVSGAALDLTLKSLEVMKSLTSSDVNVINDIEFWKNVKVVATGIGTLAALGGLAWASMTPVGRFVPIKFKLMGAAAILAAGGGAYYYITSGAEAEITNAKAVKAVNSGFDKFLKKGNPAKVFDRNIRRTLKSGGISLPSNDGAASELVYTPAETVPTEITSEEDAVAVNKEIDRVITSIESRSKDKENKADNLLGIPLSNIPEQGGDPAAQSKTAAIIADLIVGLNDGSSADDQVKEIFRALCSHPVCEWNVIDMKVGEIFIENMGKYDDAVESNFLGITTLLSSDADMAVYTFGSDPEKGLYFSKGARAGNQIEMTPNELNGYVNTRNHSVIYKCILGYDFFADDYNSTTEIDSLAKAAIEDVLGAGGLLNNFVAIEDSSNVMIPNYQEMSSGVPAKAKNIDGKTRFGAPFIVQLGELAKSKKGEDEDTILKKAKAKVDEALADISGISLPGLGDIKNVLMGLIPALIGGAAGAVGGGILGGWIGALIGGLLGGLVGYYAPALYDYITTEYFSGEKDDKDGGGGTKKTKNKDPVPLPARLSGLSRTAKGRVKQIEGIVNEYNKFYKITEDTIPTDETWEGGGTGKTDAVWRNPFIKHVFANDTVMKTKPFAPSVNSGELWIWRELSSSLISDHPEFTPDTAGCLAFCQFVYGNISSATKELDGGSGARAKLTPEAGELDDSNDDSKKPKYKKDSKYAGPDEIEIGFRLNKSLSKDKKPSSEDTRFYKKVENATFLDDIDPNVSERIKIALIRSMKVNILVSGKNGHDVFTDETYNVTFSNTKGKVKKITNQDFLTGRFENPKAKIRDVIVSYADDNLKKVLKDAELSITFRGPGKYRVPKELNERVLRKVIRKLLIEKSY